MKELKRVFEYIANVKNNFVTFTMSRGAFDKLVNEVFITDAERPPKNRIRKVIFKPNKILTLSEKLSIVGQLIGRSKKIVEEDIYQCMLDLNDNKQKITISKLAKLLECSTRTIYRNMGNQLKLEKELLNKEL
jgi:transcriptional antiterminator